jgi:hypothetical protein
MLEAVAKFVKTKMKDWKESNINLYMTNKIILSDGDNIIISYNQYPIL